MQIFDSHSSICKIRGKSIQERHLAVLCGFYLIGASLTNQYFFM